MLLMVSAHLQNPFTKTLKVTKYRYPKNNRIQCMTSLHCMIMETYYMVLKICTLLLVVYSLILTSIFEAT